MDKKNNQGNQKNNKVNQNNTASNHINVLYNIRQFIIDNYKKIILAAILLILIISGLYILFKWYKENKSDYIGYSYYGKDLKKFNNLFELSTLSYEDCKQECIRTPKCKGITLNPVDEKCYGVEEGTLRYEPENLELKTWIKPEGSIFQAKSELLLTMTEDSYLVNNAALLQPYTPGRYNYNFYIFINQFKSNAWQHVFHKGNEIKSLSNNDWDNIIREIPEQFIGVWIAPYNTYMRIAVTTKSGFIEYIDISNIPINKLTFVSVSLLDNIVEIYINAKLIKTHILASPGMFNNGHLYTKYDNTFNGELYYLTYTPEYLNHSGILALYNRTLPEVTSETIKKYTYKSS